MKKKEDINERVKTLENEVKDLEEKLKSQIEGTSRLVADCDGWREKYHRLLEEKHDPTLNQKMEELMAEKKAIEDRAKYMEHINETLEKDLRKKDEELLYLKQRSLWQRIRNR